MFEPFKFDDVSWLFWRKWWLLYVGQGRSLFLNCKDLKVIFFWGGTLFWFVYRLIEYWKLYESFLLGFYLTVYGFGLLFVCWSILIKCSSGFNSRFYILFGSNRVVYCMSDLESFLLCWFGLFLPNDFDLSIYNVF